jgi:hypothetical protein
MAQHHAARQSFRHDELAGLSSPPASESNPYALMQQDSSIVSLVAEPQRNLNSLQPQTIYHLQSQPPLAEPVTVVTHPRARPKWERSRHQPVQANSVPAVRTGHNSSLKACDSAAVSRFSDTSTFPVVVDSGTPKNLFPRSMLSNLEGHDEWICGVGSSPTRSPCKGTVRLLISGQHQAFASMDHVVVSVDAWGLEEHDVGPDFTPLISLASIVRAGVDFSHSHSPD